jgi:hypothetical protein
MESPITSPHSSIKATLDPFTTTDLFRSFFYGSLWGGAAVGVLAIGAWLISIMRKRVVIQDGRTREITNMLLHASQT